ncbi:myosin-1-like [Triticum aestivum]|uniref:myosin-1-like n=1 Tax=Triticum aestivum TaxID=4565 RepID=UPI001D03040C|nr:myosin-1-like [Triticum aestivum]
MRTVVGASVHAQCSVIPLDGTMYPRTTTCFLAAAVVLLLLPLLTSYPCTVAAHRLPPPSPPVLLLGGDASACGRSAAREGKGLAVGVARRLGHRPPVWRPPSPRPQASQGVYTPTPPPPPSINE